MGNRGEGWVILQIVALALAGLMPPLGGEVKQPHLGFIIIGSAMAVAHTWILLWSFWVLGANLRAPPDPRSGNTLITSGPYSWVRHPIYFALIGLAASWQIARANASGLVWVVLLIGVLYFKSRREEKKLLQIHPEYAEYQRRVALIIPFLAFSKIGSRKNLR